MTVREPVAPADTALLLFLRSVELAIADLYDKVLPLLGDSAKPIAAKFQAHHRDYADSLGKLAGGGPTLPGANATLSLVLAARLQSMSDERTALTATAAIENQLAATYAFTFTTLTSPDVIKLLVTILPVVSAHAATLGGLAVLPTAAVFPNGPFESTVVAGTDSSDIKAGFDPAAFPVG